MTLAAPAFAGTEDGETSNPFTEPSAGQTTTSGAVNTGDTPTQQPATPGEQSIGEQPTHPDETKSSGSFYQQQKKDTDGH